MKKILLAILAVAAEVIIFTLIKMFIPMEHHAIAALILGIIFMAAIYNIVYLKEDN